MNRWEIYEFLKGNANYTEKELKEADKEEIIEGIIEYLNTKKCK